MPEWIAQYWVEWLFGVIIAGLTIGVKHLSKKVKVDTGKRKALEDGVCALLRNQIVHEFNRYTEKGYYPIYGRENVEKMYKAYSALGGNGTISDLVTGLKKLPNELKEGEQ